MRKRGNPALMLILLLLWSHAGLGAEVMYHEAEGWSLDLPEGWGLLSSDASLRYTAFANPGGSINVQVFFLAKPGDQDPKAANATFRTKLKASLAEGDLSSFAWNGRDAWLADIRYTMGQGRFRGYLLTVGLGKESIAVLAGSTESDWNSNHGWLVSSLDSLALSQDDWSLPGPISAALDGPDTAAHIQANQDCIEREALVLSAYQQAPQELQFAAWNRFYRVIYRDSFSRLAEDAATVRTALIKQKIPLADHPAQLAAWLQDFTYERPGTLSDLRSPLSAIMEKTGDCDARGLVFMIMLRHWGVPSILMVSPKFQHSLVGIDLAGDGARFAFAGNKWLIAELTAKVALGQIEQKMSSSADWIGMNLEYDPWSAE